jgi:hypothetical protein
MCSRLDRTPEERIISCLSWFKFTMNELRNSELETLYKLPKNESNASVG